VPFRGKGAVMLDLDGRIAFASTYFCDLVGIQHDKVAGMSYLDFVFPEDIDQVTSFFGENKLGSGSGALTLRRFGSTSREWRCKPPEANCTQYQPLLRPLHPPKNRFQTETAAHYTLRMSSRQTLRTS
jgi:PAS domain-containing protein